MGEEPSFLDCSREKRTSVERRDDLGFCAAGDCPVKLEIACKKGGKKERGGGISIFAAPFIGAREKKIWKGEEKKKGRRFQSLVFPIGNLFDVLGRGKKEPSIPE